MSNPRRTDRRTRIALVLLSRFFDWRQALVNVKPKTFVRWQRLGFRLLWREKSRPGRPSIPQELQELIWRMAKDNPTWGQVRIANELLLKLGLRVSPRTMARHMPPLREAIPDMPRYRFLIHDRDSIFSAELDSSVRNLGLRILKTPYRSSRANALSERLIGTLRREALD